MGFLPGVKGLGTAGLVDSRLGIGAPACVKLGGSLGPRDM